MECPAAFLATLVCVAALLSAPCGRAEEAPPPPAPANAEDIARWVKALSSEVHEERARASKALEDLGAKALPALRAAAAGEDAVAKDEASKIIERIDQKLWLERLKDSAVVMAALKKLCATKVEYKPGWLPQPDAYKPELNELEGALKTLAMPYPRKFKLQHGTFCLLGHFGAGGGQLEFVSAYRDGSFLHRVNRWGDWNKFFVGKLDVKRESRPGAAGGSQKPTFFWTESTMALADAPPGTEGAPLSALESFDDLAALLSEAKPGEDAPSSGSALPAAAPATGECGDAAPKAMGASP